MDIRNIKNTTKVPFELEAWSLIKTEKAELVFLTMLPGETLEKHKNPFDVIFFVVSGSGRLQIEEAEEILYKNDSIFIDNTKNRGWINNTNEKLVVLVYKILH